MASLEELRTTRIQKLELLKKAGMNPYPSKIPRDISLADAKARFVELEKVQKPVSDTPSISVAGRVMAIRGQGAILFIVLDDGTGKFQAVFKKDVLSPELFDLFSLTIDIGDIISVTGNLFVTQRGEQSILVSSWVIGTKSLLPLPEKWHGIQDADERYRKRYLDFVMNPPLRELFYKKAKFWEVTRRMLKEEGFIEVETPTLEVTTGGAEATPFKTHHNDFDLPVYLRISVGELWQKRLMAAGFPRTYEIGRVYRNEGSSPDHLQEFTNMEFYAAYMDFDEGVTLTEKMIKTLAQETFGTLSFTARGHSFDLSGKETGGVWPRIDYVETVKKMTGVDVLNANEKEMSGMLDNLKIKYEGTNRERLTDTLWKFCRKQIAGPAWLVNHPKLVSPLSKVHPDNPLLTLRAQLILAGAEVTNGFAELNDAQDQKARFDGQKKLIEAGDTEAMMPDDEFVEMLEHGMPPTFGFAYGDRLFAFLAGEPARETQLFPLMRPKGGEGEGGQVVGKNKDDKKIAVAVINTSAITADWQKLNTLAHLGASLGSHVGSKLLFRNTIETSDGHNINLNIQHPIIIKQASSNKGLVDLVNSAKKQGLEVEEFTKEMMSTSNDKKVVAATAGLKFADIERLGILVFGPKKAVEELTADFELAK